jgi:multicomponent Na+:H+ antiporter subunit C
MSLLLAVTIGTLVGVGVLHLLQRDVVRMVVGLYTLWNAINLFVIGVAALRGRQAPVGQVIEQPAADPLSQAVVLTAIVITFGFTALLVTMILWLSRRKDAIDIVVFGESRELPVPPPPDRRPEPEA